MQTSVQLETRDFEPANKLATLGRGRGVASGDINGDGAFDVVCADDNKLVILLAELGTR